MGELGILADIGTQQSTFILKKTMAKLGVLLV